MSLLASSGCTKLQKFPNSRSFLIPEVFKFAFNVAVKAGNVGNAICFFNFEERIDGDIKVNSARTEFLEFSNLVIVKQPRANYKYL